MNHKKLITFFSLIVLLVILFTNGTPSQSSTKTYTVKLYSENGQVLGTWKSREIGRVEGSTLLFSTANDLNGRMVRISGTFSVEQDN